MNENFLQAILQSIAWLLTRLLSVLTPLFIGLAIAYLLHPAVDWLTQKLRRRGLAILLTYLLAACFLGGLICGFDPRCPSARKPSRNHDPDFRLF